MASIVIRVGAARDASLATAFAPLEQAARKARAALASEGKSGGEAVAKGMKGGVDKAEAAFERLAREISGEGKKMMDPGVAAVDNFAKEAKSKFAATKSSFDAMARQLGKEMDKLDAKQKSGGAQGRDAKGRFTAGGAGGGNDAKRVAGQVGRTALSFGARTAGGVLSGEGVETSLSALVARNVSLEKRSAEIVNSGYLPGAAGANGQRQSVAGVSSQVMGISKATATDTDSVSEGLQNFTKLTGDLETGRAILMDMAVLSKATGSDMGDMGSAAANIAAQFEGMPDKAERTKQVLAGLVAQGKVGAVEISDMAAQMAKVSAASGRFEGDQSKNMAFFSAMAQEARKSGGASSATMAATAVGGFSDVFTKNARQEAFRSFEVKTEGAPGQIRNAQDIILDSLNAAATKHGGMKNFTPNLGKMFATQTSQRAVGGFAQIYSRTYSSTQGSEQEKLAAATAAVRLEMETLTRASMGAVERMDSFKIAMGTTDSKATELSLQLQESAKIVQGALDGVLYPAIESAAKWFNKFDGDEGAKDNAAAVAAQLAGGNAQGAIAQALRGGSITQEQYDQLTGVGAQQKGAIDQQKGHAKQSAAGFLGEHLLPLFDYTPTGMAVNWADKHSGGQGNLGHESGDALERNRKSAELNVQQLTQQNAELSRAMRELTEHMKNGTIKIVSVDKPPPAVDQGGRTGGGTGAPPRTKAPGKG